MLSLFLRSILTVFFSKTGKTGDIYRGWIGISKALTSFNRNTLVEIVLREPSISWAKLSQAICCAAEINNSLPDFPLPGLSSKVFGINLIKDLSNCDMLHNCTYLLRKLCFNLDFRFIFNFFHSKIYI